MQMLSNIQRLQSAIANGDILDMNLLVPGTRLDAPPCNGDLPLCTAMSAKKTAFVWQLLSAEANPNLLQIPGLSSSTLTANRQRFPKQSVLSSVKPLHFAVVLNSSEILKALLAQASVIVNAIDADGKTALHWAAELGNVTMMRQLLQAVGIDCNAINALGCTPLHLAACHGHVEVTAVLLEDSRVVRSIEDSFQQTPLQLAASNNHSQVVKLLQQYGEHLHVLSGGPRNMLDALVGAHSKQVEAQAELQDLVWYHMPHHKCASAHS